MWSQASFTNLRGTVTGWLYGGLIRASLWFARRSQWNELELAALFGAEDEAEAFRGKVEQALTAIERYAPTTLRRMQKDVCRVVMFPIGGAAGRYVHALRACVLSPEFVLAEETGRLRIALVLVHEATHARLSRSGLDARKHPELHVRIERICNRSELAFARRVPGLPSGTPSKFYSAFHTHASSPCR